MVVGMVAVAAMVVVMVVVVMRKSQMTWRRGRPDHVTKGERFPITSDLRSATCWLALAACSFRIKLNP